MHPSAQKVAHAARALGLSVEIVEFEETTRTAQDAAHTIDCQVAQIVKSLLFIVDGQPVMALVSGVNRLDERKLAALRGVGRKQVERADADIAKAATGFSIGGVPPLWAHIPAAGLRGRRPDPLRRSVGRRRHPFCCFRHHTGRIGTCQPSHRGGPKADGKMNTMALPQATANLPPV
jgi:hypothetical protein